MESFKLFNGHKIFSSSYENYLNQIIKHPFSEPLFQEEKNTDIKIDRSIKNGTIVYKVSGSSSQEDEMCGVDIDISELPFFVSSDGRCFNISDNGFRHQKSSFICFKNDVLHKNCLQKICPDGLFYIKTANEIFSVYLPDQCVACCISDNSHALRFYKHVSNESFDFEIIITSCTKFSIRKYIWSTQKKFQDVVFKFVIGENSVYRSFNREFTWVMQISLLKICIQSFQHFFPDSQFVVLYNGRNYPQFIRNSNLNVNQIIDQRTLYDKKYFYQQKTGVWWKWNPFRICDLTEIQVDADMVAVSDPLWLKHWILYGKDILIAENDVSKFGESFKDQFDPPYFNVGLLGVKNNIDLEQDIQSVAKKHIHYERSADANFLDEQGAINYCLKNNYKERVDLARYNRNIGLGFPCYWNGLEILHFVGVFNKTWAHECRNILQEGFGNSYYYDNFFAKDLFAARKRFAYRQNYDKFHIQPTNITQEFRKFHEWNIA